MLNLIGFQDSATPVMEGIVDLHNHIFFFLVLVLMFVCWMFGNIVYNFWYLLENPKKGEDVLSRKVWYNLRNYTHGTAIEVIWTLIPSGILVLIAIPSFALLYAMDEVVGPGVTLKVLGNQWYWSYEYSDYYYLDDEDGYNIAFDSYMLDTAELAVGQHRLLEVDNEIVLPTNVHVRVIISAVDVLHSWSVNALGVKVDAVPGRLNQAALFIKREGTYYGQCSELCGVNHGFMPIAVKAVSLADYKTWLLNIFNS